MIRPILCALVPVLLMTVGCGSATSPSPGAGDHDAHVPHGNYVSDALPEPFSGGDSLRVTFGDGEISFRATCNTMSGATAWDDGTLTVTRLGSTEIGCPGRADSQDQWLVDFFSSSPDLSVDGTDVRLAAGGTEIWLVPTDEVTPDSGPDVPLEGTTWRLAGIETRDGDSAGVMVVGRHRAVLRIQDGDLQFDTTCNDGSGAVKVVGDRLRLRGIAVTLVGCLDERAEIEHEVTGVLQPKWVGWSIDGEELRLTRGAHTLIYRAMRRPLGG